MAAYKHGSMDISAQKKTFEGFLRGSVWVICIVFAILIFLALFNS